MNSTKYTPHSHALLLTYHSNVIPVILLARLNVMSRVGGAQHLKVHLDPGLSHDALRWAGVWTDDAMANYYGGCSTEAF